MSDERKIPIGHVEVANDDPDRFYRDALLAGVPALESKRPPSLDELRISMPDRRFIISSLTDDAKRSPASTDWPEVGAKWVDPGGPAGCAACVQAVADLRRFGWSLLPCAEPAKAGVAGDMEWTADEWATESMGLTPAEPVKALLPAAPEIGNRPAFVPLHNEGAPIPKLSPLGKWMEIAQPPRCPRCHEFHCSLSCSSGEGYRRIVEAKRKAEGERAKREEEARERAREEMVKTGPRYIGRTREQSSVYVRHCGEVGEDGEAAREASAASERPFAWVVR